MKKVLSILAFALLSIGMAKADTHKTRYYIYTNGEISAVANTENVETYRYTTGQDNITFFTNEDNHSDGSTSWTTSQAEIDATETSSLKVRCLGGNDEGTDTWVFGFANNQPTSFPSMHGGWDVHVSMTTNSENAIEIRLGENAEQVGNCAKYTIPADASRRGTSGKRVEVTCTMSNFFSFSASSFTNISGEYCAIAGNGNKDGDNNDVFVTIEEIYLERTYGDDYTVSTPETWSADNYFATLTINADLTIEQGTTIIADNVVVPVAADGTAPQIIVKSGAKLVANQSYTVKRQTIANQWALLSMPSPFNFNTGVSASWGTTITKRSHTPASHHNYESNPDNIWNGGVWGDIVYTARDGKRDYANGNNTSFAIAFKTDRDDIVTIVGEGTTIEGKDYSLSNLWQSAWQYEENFNLIGQPFTSDYAGVFKSPNASARPNAQKGVVTYQYDAANDIFVPNLVMDNAATYKPYEAFFTQSYENLSAPLTPVTTTGETYDVTQRFSLMLGNDKVRFVEMSTATEAFSQNIDAVKLFGLNDDTPAVYTFKDGSWRMSAAVVPSFSGKTYNIGVKLPSAGNYSLTAADLTSDYRLIVTDNVEHKTVVLKNGESYTFTAASEQTGRVDDRFTVEYAPKLVNISGSTTQLELQGAFRTDDFNALEKDMATMTSADMTQVKAITLDGFTNVKAAINPNCLYYMASTVADAVKPVANVVVTDGESYTAQEIILTDKRDFCNTHAFTAVKATYNRTFTADKKETLYLPFTPDAAKGKYYGYTETAEVEGEDVPVARFTSTTTPAANTPYLFIANSDAAESGKMEAADVVIPATPLQAETGFIGILCRQTVPDGAFGFQNDKFNIVMSADAGNPVKISAFRAYLLEPASGEAKTLRVEYFEAMEGQEPQNNPDDEEPQQATAISQLQAGSGATVSIYTLDGTPIGNHSTRERALAGLSKGIYIICEGSRRTKIAVK